MASGTTPTERRTFRLEEATRLLPAVRERTRVAMERLSSIEIESAEDGGTRHEQLQKAAGRILEEWAGEIQAWGIEVKGPWLVDFDSGAGYYCWKWPEESLEFFHGYDEGFSGRVRLQ